MRAKSFLLWLSGPKLQSKISFEPLVKYGYNIVISGETCMQLESHQNYFSLIGWEPTGRENNIDNLAACKFSPQISADFETGPKYFEYA